MTLDGAAFLEVALRLTAFAGAFRGLAGDFRDFLVARTFADLRAGLLADGARLAFAFTAFALTLFFAVLADAPRPEEREEDRRRPFVRLLLIVYSRKAALGKLAALNLAELTIAQGSKSINTRI